MIDDGVLTHVSKLSASFASPRPCSTDNWKPVGRVISRFGDKAPQIAWRYICQGRLKRVPRRTRLDMVSHVI